jgi:hypothetical protein
MSALSTSQERLQRRQRGLQRKIDEDRITPEEADAMTHLYNTWEQQRQAQEQDPAWRENNLEWDLRNQSWILDKARASDRYAQNLYAALCNNDFQHQAVMPILRDQHWGCSWRYAGGIVADMREQGDYMDWYCSGIGDGLGNGDADGVKGYVGEGTVTDEIRDDLLRLGWRVVDDVE